MKAIPRNESSEALMPLFFEMGRLLKREMSADGYGPVTYLHVETMRHLAEAGGADMGAVAQYLCVAAPSATAVVNGLVKDGLIERRPDPEDRRRVLLFVTKKGARILEEATRRRGEAFARLIAPLASRDIAELVRVLRIITTRS